MPAEFEKIRKGIEDSLKKKYPKWKSDKIKNTSWAMAIKKWKEMGKKPFW